MANPNIEKEKPNLTSSNINLTPDELFELERFQIREKLIEMATRRQVSETRTEKERLRLEYNKIYETNIDQLDLTTQEQKRKNELYQKKYSFGIQRGQAIAERLRYELIKAPGATNLEGFPTNEEEDSSKPNKAEVRILLTRLPENIRPIFEQFFIMELLNVDYGDPNTDQGRQRNDILNQAQSGAIIQPYNDPLGQKKFKIYIDIKAFYEEEEKKIDDYSFTFESFNVNKFIYIVTRAIISTLKDKKEFQEHLERDKNLKGKSIDKNVPTDNIDDWIAYCLAYPENAQKLYPELYTDAHKWLTNMMNQPEKIQFSKDVSQTIIKNPDFDPKLISTKSKWKSKYSGKELGRGWSKWLDFWHNIGLGGIGSYFYSLAEWGAYLKETSDNAYHMFLAENDGKEVNKLKSLDLSGGDYVKMLRRLTFYNDPDKMRQLIIVIAGKNSYQPWMGQLWLWRFDDTFKNTKGKEVSSTGFDFLTRVTKAYAVGAPLAQVEYKKVGNRFVRFSYKDQLNKVDGVLNTMSLRDIQRIKPEVFQNLRIMAVKSKDKFLSINAKLGDNLIEGDTSNYVSSDTKLNDLMGKKEAESFIEDMKDYAENLHEEEFLSLTPAGVRSLIRRYNEAARTEKYLFNLFTGPVLRQAYEQYRNDPTIGEPFYTKEKYEEDFAQEKNDIKEHNYNIEETLKSKSIDEIRNIYHEFGKIERQYPFVRGFEKTKTGRILEFIDETKENIRYQIKNQLGLSNETLSFIMGILDDLQQKQAITPEDITLYTKRIEKLTENIAPEKIASLRKYINTFFNHLENLGIVKQYQLIFKPFEEHIKLYKGETKSISEDSGKKIIKWFYSELFFNDELNYIDILNTIHKNHPEIEFNAFDHEKIANSNHKKTDIALILQEKINKGHKSKKGMLNSDFEKLNRFYYDFTGHIKFPDQMEKNFDKYRDKFRSLDLIPDEVKNKGMFTPDDLLYNLNVVKVITDDYISSKQEKKKKKQEKELFGSKESVEDLYYMEEEDEGLA